MVKPKFPTVNRSFHAELKKRINDYFQSTGKSYTGNIQLYLKAVILMASFLFLYIHLVFFTPGNFLAVVECIVLGFVVAGIGFNIMHDGGHGSFSRSKFVNNLAAFSLNILGGSSFMWNVKHNIIHHAYTNIDGVDDDIEIKPMLRMCSSQKRYFIHRFQHIYVWFLYTLLLIVWVFLTDYTKYFKRKVGTVPIKKMSIFEHFAFWIAKVGYIFGMILVPIYLVGFLPWLVGFLIIAMFAGFVLSIVFQLAHTVEETTFPVPDADLNKIENEWAIHQIETTANFATKNKLICWLVGGLNFQIEHHLFPKISHIHYPAISKIIKQTCEEYGVKYIEFRRMRHAIVSHTVHLRNMGRA